MSHCQVGWCRRRRFEVSLAEAEAEAVLNFHTCELTQGVVCVVQCSSSPDQEGMPEL